VNEDVRRYYAHFAEREWRRLDDPADGQVEFAITCDALARRLPPGTRVLDLGGGPGRYTICLAERGYHVTLADLSPELLAIARTRVGEAGVDDHVDAILEVDARDLSVFADASFDAVVCLGPFYHLPDRGERIRAASELSRVLKPGGVAFVAFMPRLAHLRRTLAIPDERHHLLQPGFVEQLLDEGALFNDVPGRFTHGYGARPEEIAPFFETVGLHLLELLSTESITVGLQDALPGLLAEPPLAELLLTLAIRYAAYPSVLGLANHLLYVGRRPPDPALTPGRC
jgi:ubiquinone/menaquinone biosynthesis C-methylase UbiE